MLSLFRGRHLAAKQFATMLARPQIARATGRHKITPIIVRFVVIKVMHLQRSAVLRLRDAATAAIISIPFTNATLQRTCEAWPVWQRGDATTPVRMSFTRRTAHSQLARDSVSTPKERIVRASQIAPAHGGGYPLLRFKTVCPTSRDRIRAAKSLSSRCRALSNFLQRQALAEIGPCYERAGISGEALIPCWLPFFKERFSSRRLRVLRVMPVRISCRRAGLRDWRNENAAITCAGNLWKRSDFLSFPLTIRALSFGRRHSHGSEANTSAVPARRYD